MVNTVISLPAKNPEGIDGKMMFEHLALRTTDFDRTIEWYQQKLGFRIVKKWEVPLEGLLMAFMAPANDDEFWLEIIQGPTEGSHQDPTLPIISGYQHFSLTVESVDETIAALRARGVSILRQPFDFPTLGKRLAFVTDLHGNVIEFTENISR
jgi:lactoylglutathione lyase